MMDSKSVVVVKAKYRLSISICIPLSGKVVSFLSNWNQAGGGGDSILIFLAGVVSSPAMLTFPISSLPTNYSDMNFPVPDFWQAPLMMLIRDDESSTQVELSIGLSCRGWRRMWTEIIWLSSDTSGYNKTRQIIWFPTQGSHPGLIPHSLLNTLRLDGSDDIVLDLWQGWQACHVMEFLTFYSTSMEPPSFHFHPNSIVFYANPLFTLIIQNKRFHPSLTWMKGRSDK